MTCTPACPSWRTGGTGAGEELSDIIIPSFCMIHVRSRTPSKLEKVEAEAGPVQVVHCLRLLSALEDSLGSLGPVVNQILGKALSIEQVGGEGYLNSVFLY